MRVKPEERSEPHKEWTKPELVDLDAGATDIEALAGTNTDGLEASSS